MFKIRNIMSDISDGLPQEIHVSSLVRKIFWHHRDTREIIDRRVFGHTKIIECKKHIYSPRERGQCGIRRKGEKKEIVISFDRRGILTIPEDSVPMTREIATKKETKGIDTSTRRTRKDNLHRRKNTRGYTSSLSTNKIPSR